MSNFNKANFVFDGTSKEIYLSYEGRFVARFKYKAPKANANHFIKFLIANYSVEEYFAEIDKGRAPGVILRDKGFVDYNSTKIIKAAGYAPTLEGKNAYLEMMCAKPI